MDRATSDATPGISPGDSSTSDGKDDLVGLRHRRWPPPGRGLLERGWALLVSVVSEAATRARSHPALHFQVGALQEDGDVDRLLERHKPRWVIDATHPFAAVISNRLQRCCQAKASHCCGSNGMPPGRIMHAINQLEELKACLSNERLYWRLAHGIGHGLRFSPPRSIARPRHPESLRPPRRWAPSQQPPASGQASSRREPSSAPFAGAEGQRWSAGSPGLTQQIWQSLSEELSCLILIKAPSVDAEQGLTQGAIHRQVREPPERHE